MVRVEVTFGEDAEFFFFDYALNVGQALAELDFGYVAGVQLSMERDFEQLVIEGFGVMGEVLTLSKSLKKGLMLVWRSFK